MGTNFYIKDDKLGEIHVGKRSAAGLYCWDCNVTLCIEGHGGVNLGCKNWTNQDKKCDGTYSGSCGGGHWFESCPSCGATRSASEDLTNSAVGRELGFNKTPFKTRSGVSSCSSFTWAGRRVDLLSQAASSESSTPIYDEYGTAMSIAEFVEMLEECPIQKHLLGVEFS